MIAVDRKRARRGNVAGVVRLVGLGALALTAACTTKGEGLILVKLSSSPAPDHVRVVIASPSDHKVLGTATADWPAMPPLPLGIYVGKSVSGSVDVVACGFDASENLVASTPEDPGSFTATAQPGATSTIVTITLAAGPAPALCEPIGSGGHGGSGTGGSAGATGGSIGATGGTGGSTSGTGGTGGTGGVGGTTGTGGVSGTSGTGGVAGTIGIGGIGGTVGTAGRGGTGGSGGVAATGGRGGTGGTAGGAGRGGSGGGSVVGMWTGAVPVGTVAGASQTYPAVAVDAIGNAVVAYEQGSQIWASKYTAVGGGSWSTPTPVDSRGNVCCKPSVAVDKNGNWLVVWGIGSGSLQGIWQSTSADGIQWSTPTSITVTSAYGPVLAMNANGAAIVAWKEQVTGGNYQAAASVRTTPGTSWSAPMVMRPADDQGDRTPTVAIAGNGNAFVGWVQADGANPPNYFDSIWVRQYTAGAGAGWNAAGLFEGYVDYNAYDVNIAINTNGDAIVTYIQITSSNPRSVQLWARRYSVTTNSFASIPSLVFDSGSLDAYVPPAVALDDAGNATVAFAVETSTGYQVQTSRTSPTDPNWPAVPTAMETDNVAKSDDPNSAIAYVTMPALRADPAGNVTLIWRKRTAASGKRFDLVARRYTAGAWGPQAVIGTHTTNSVFWPTLGINASGTSVATWYFGTGLDVQANVFH
jgi:hypothetical protein